MFSSRSQSKCPHASRDHCSLGAKPHATHPVDFSPLSRQLDLIICVLYREAKANGLHIVGSKFIDDCIGWQSLQDVSVYHPCILQPEAGDIKRGMSKEELMTFSAKELEKFMERSHINCNKQKKSVNIRTILKFWEQGFWAEKKKRKKKQTDGAWSNAVYTKRGRT